MNTYNDLATRIETPIEHKTLKWMVMKFIILYPKYENIDSIVFLHPAFSDHRAFEQQIESFSKDYKVITVDLIGHGLSKANKSNDKIDASSVHKIFESEGLDRVDLVVFQWVHCTNVSHFNILIK
ncbi:MAG: alpha/beta hydrolase [Bacteroidetes bacterium]|nr:alpha/beta hydrolase [Bacteroidota bacterium]